MKEEPKRALPTFEVSEDLKSSSVGAEHWSTGPIAPSRAKKLYSLDGKGFVTYPIDIVGIWC